MITGAVVPFLKDGPPFCESAAYQEILAMLISRGFRCKSIVIQALAACTSLKRTAFQSKGFVFNSIMSHHNYDLH